MDPGGRKCDSMFSSSLSTLKKRTTELGGLLNEVTDKVSTASGLPNVLFQGNKGANEVDIPLTADGPFFVRYSLQNGDDEDQEGAVFVLPIEFLSRSVTQATLRSHFPLPGSFHFRFKYSTDDGSFGGYVWLDLPDESAKVPVFMGGISMKALRLPDGSASQSQGLPPTSQNAPAQQANQQVSQLPLGAAQLGTADMPSFDPNPRPSVPSAPSTPAGPPADMMDFDMGGSGGAGVPGPPAAPVQMPNREDLVKKRLDDKQARIDAANAKHTEQQSKEEEMKKSKVDLANKLGEELDRWAKTADGSSFKDIRSLLVTLHEVMWTNSGWAPLAMSELIQEGRIKKYYRKAILLTHPDRQQDNAEQQVRADRIFHALNESFKKESG